MPGWAAMMPLRRLLVEHTLARGSLSAPSRASTFLDLADKFGSLDMRYFANHPKLAKRLERLKSHHPNYIVHEYFNQDSNPFYFMDLAQELAEAKLSWVGPANALDTLDEVSLTKEQRDFLGGDRRCRPAPDDARSHDRPAVPARHLHQGAGAPARP